MSKSEGGGGCCGGGKKTKGGAGAQGAGGLSVKNAEPFRQVYKPQNSTLLSQQPMQQKMIEAKVVLLGDSGVGKSSIAQRFIKNIFPDQYDVTIGGAYFQQTISLSPNEAGGLGTQVKLHIWDTGGSEKFRSMIKLYYKDAAAAIICYDVSDEKTFQSVYYWINQMNENASNTGEGANFVMALAGNKCDLDPAQVKIPLETAIEVAKKHNMIHAETSAKSGKGVQELFKKIAEKIVISRMMGEQNGNSHDLY